MFYTTQYISYIVLYAFGKSTLFYIVLVEMLFFYSSHVFVSPIISVNVRLHTYLTEHESSLLRNFLFSVS